MPQLFGPLIAAIGIPGLTAAGGGLTILGKIVVAGIGIALSIGAELLLGTAQKRPKPQDVKTVVRASVTPRVRHYGRNRTGGALALIQGKEGDLYQIVMFGLGPWDGIEAYIVDDEEVSLNGSGYATGDPYDADSIEIHTKLGTNGQTAFSELTPLLTTYTSDHRLRGVACGLIIAHAVDQDRFSKVYPNKFPVLNVIFRGVQVYDPRSETTAFSTNLALQLRDYLIHPDGGRMDADLIDEDLFSAAADICDENVTIKAGGTIKRYHGALTYKLDEEPRDVIQRFLVAMDGRMFLTPEGKIGIHAGKWITPTVTLTDDHIIDYDLEDGAGPHRRANEVTVKYTQVEATYAEATADPWRDDAAIAADGIVRPLSPEIYEVQHHNHARRLAKLIEHRANPEWIGTIRTTLAGLECFDQRWIRVQIDDLDIDMNFEIMGWRLDTSEMTVILDVQSFSALAYTFNPSAEEGTAPAVPSGTGGGGGTIPAPVSVTAASNARNLAEVTYTDTVWDNVTETNDPTENTAGVSALTMTVTVPTPPKASLRTQIQYSVDGSGDWEQLPVNTESNKATTSPLARGTTYIARARYKSPGGASDWTESNTVTMPS